MAFACEIDRTDVRRPLRLRISGWDFVPCTGILKQRTSFR